MGGTRQFSGGVQEHPFEFSYPCPLLFGRRSGSSPPPMEPEPQADVRENSSTAHHITIGALQPLDLLWVTLESGWSRTRPASAPPPHALYDSLLPAIIA